MSTEMKSKMRENCLQVMESPEVGFWGSLKGAVGNLLRARTWVYDESRFKTLMWSFLPHADNIFG